MTWLGGAGLRTVAGRAGLDCKTARRYVAAAEAAGVVREGGVAQLTLFGHGSGDPEEVAEQFAVAGAEPGSTDRIACRVGDEDAGAAWAGKMFLLRGHRDQLEEAPARCNRLMPRARSTSRVMTRT